MDTITIYKVDFGERVSRLRQRRNLTQAELAEKLDMARSSVANLEAGRQNITLETAYIIALVLGVEIVELFPPQIYGNLEETERMELNELRARVSEMERVIDGVRSLVFPM